MINIGLYYRVKKGHELEFEGYFGRALAYLTKADIGFLSGRLYKEVSDESEYMIYTEWRDAAAFKAFMESHAYRHTVESGRSIIEGQPRHRIFNER